MLIYWGTINQITFSIRQSNLYFLVCLLMFWSELPKCQRFDVYICCYRYGICWRIVKWIQTLIKINLNDLYLIQQYTRKYLNITIKWRLILYLYFNQYTECPSNIVDKLDDEKWNSQRLNTHLCFFYLFILVIMQYLFIHFKLYL